MWTGVGCSPVPSFPPWSWLVCPDDLSLCLLDRPQDNGSASLRCQCFSHQMERLKDKQPVKKNSPSQSELKDKGQIFNRFKYSHEHLLLNISIYDGSDCFVISHYSCVSSHGHPCRVYKMAASSDDMFSWQHAAPLPWLHTPSVFTHLFMGGITSQSSSNYLGYT